MSKEDDLTYQIDHDNLDLIVATKRMKPRTIASQSRLDIRTVGRILDPASKRKIARLATLERLCRAIGCGVDEITVGYPDNPVKQAKDGSLVPLYGRGADAA